MRNSIYNRSERMQFFHTFRKTYLQFNCSFFFFSQLRDDFIETPPLPPDAIAWIVSDFQRESLEPSLTYQTSTTTVTPVQLQRTTKSPTDNYTLRTDKRPIKNIITTSLTKHFQVGKNASVTADKVGNGRNGTGFGNDSDSNADDSEVRSAPSYTFYAPDKILKGSHIVLQTSRDVLEYLQVWLNVKYPLAKLGMFQFQAIIREE